MQPARQEPDSARRIAHTPHQTEVDPDSAVVDGSEHQRLGQVTLELRLALLSQDRNVDQGFRILGNRSDICGDTKKL